MKSYADPKRKEVSYFVGHFVFLKVSSMKRVMRFGNKRKLAPRYIRSFEVQSRVGEVTYRLVLLPELSRIHPIFTRIGVEKVYCVSFACTSASSS